MKTFEDFGLSKTLEKSIINMGFKSPTPVQEQSIPVALKGKDILGSAQTGTGKTGAFSIPLIQILMRNEHASALVLTPTRELARQVIDVIDKLLLGQNSIDTVCLIGGEQITKQLKQLKKKPRVIVGTPGRINDHIERKSLKLNNIKFLVLDETDRMLDMGFGVQINRILKHVSNVRQTLMFSATLPEQIVKLSKRYLTKPERISIGKSNVVASNIENEIIKIEKEDKYQLLLEQLEKREGTVLIFVKTKHSTVKMAKNLSKDHFISEPLNGNLRQNKRDKVMKKFRENKFRIMVATDIAARGLDVPHIEHVINYDLPQLAEDYIHRLGRTGRANAVGSAATFVSNKEIEKWKEIKIMLDPSIKRSNSKNKNTSSRNKNRSSQNKSKSKVSYSKSRRLFSDNSSRSDRFSNQKNNTDFQKDRSNIRKKKKKFRENKLEKDNETSTSFFKKKKIIKNNNFKFKNNKKNKSSKLNASNSKSSPISKFKKKKSVNSFSKKRQNKRRSRKR